MFTEPGGGAGKGGGAGGPIREAGGSMGKQGATLEEEYFRRKEAEQLKAMKEQAQSNPSSTTSKKPTVKE